MESASEASGATFGPPRRVQVHICMNFGVSRVSFCNLVGVHDAPPPPKTPPRATGFVAVLLRQLVGSSWGRYPLVIYWTCGSQNRGPRSEEDNLPRPIALEKLVKSEKRLAPLPPHSPQPNPMPKSTSWDALLIVLGSFWGRFGSILGSFWLCFSIVSRPRAIPMPTLTSRNWVFTKKPDF